MHLLWSSFFAWATNATKSLLSLAKVSACPAALKYLEPALPIYTGQVELFVSWEVYIGPACVPCLNWLLQPVVQAGSNLLLCWALVNLNGNASNVRKRWHRVSARALIFLWHMPLGERANSAEKFLSTRRVCSRFTSESINVTHEPAWNWLWIDEMSVLRAWISDLFPSHLLLIRLGITLALWRPIAAPLL